MKIVNQYQIYYKIINLIINSFCSRKMNLSQNKLDIWNKSSAIRTKIHSQNKIDISLEDLTTIKKDHNKIIEKMRIRTQSFLFRNK